MTEGRIGRNKRGVRRREEKDKSLKVREVRVKKMEGEREMFVEKARRNEKKSEWDREKGR